MPILAGTDAPNPGTIHGASLHHELQLLVESGLSPIDALRAATSLPAMCFGLNDRGIIASGKRADLVLVKGDPARRIEDTTRIVGVWKNGRLIDRDQRKKAIANSNTPDGKSDLPIRVISHFDSGDPASDFGAGWMGSTDSIMGGSSTVAMKVVPGGAVESKHSLLVTGTTQKRQPAFSGVMFSPADVPMQPADISGHATLAFWAKGNGSDHKIMLFFQKRGFQPAIKKFRANKEWQQYSFAIKDFEGCDGTDVTGIWFGNDNSGDFQFQVDEVVLKK